MTKMEEAATSSPSTETPWYPLASSPAPHFSPLVVSSSLSSSSMASTSLSWHWIIESLTDCKQVDTSILRAWIFKDPELLTGAPRPVREKVALRYLEELVGMDRGEGPSEWASTLGIDVSQSCEEVLCRETRKFYRVVRLFKLEKDRVNLLSHDLHKFILQKRASLSKSALNKIKAAILQGHCPALLPMKVFSDLPIQNEVDYPQCDVGIGSQRVGKLKVSIRNAEIQPLRPSSAAISPSNCIGLLQEENPICIQRLLKQNVADFDKMLQRDDVNTGCNYQRSNDFTENERLKKIKLSTKDYHFHSVEKNSSVLAPGSSIAISQGDPSESMQNPLKQNSADADNAINGVQAIRQSSMCEQPGQKNINASNVQIPQPQQISACPVPANDNIIMQADSAGLGQHLPNVLNGYRNCPLHMDIFVARDDHAHFVKDASITSPPCNKDGNLQHAPSNGSGENMNLAFYEKSHLNVQLSVTPAIARDDGSHDVPSDMDPNNDVFSAEKHCLLSSHVHINDNSAIDTEGDLCIKCDKGGELLTCAGGCLISIHETCLGSSAKSKVLGPFYCPFCSYTRIAVAHRKAKNKFFEARKALLAFIGWDFVQGHSEASQARVVGNSWYKRDKPNETSMEANEQTRQMEVAHADRKVQNLGSERSSDISHNLTEVNDDKNVRKVTSPIQKINANLSNEEIVLGNYGEQIEVAEHQQLGEPHSASDNIHLTCLEDPCHARYIHDAEQGDIGMIDDHSNIQQLKNHEEEEDHDTVDKVSTGQKHGKRRQQDASVVDNHGKNNSSPGKVRKV